ncbi:MAG TPA: carbohydrate-binding module family 20 domain-containing protein [Spirochaetota bacterium]|nr:carbohydrate-binding module family 20 domain-containing protein [Spirochaetota bacterium]HOL56870.1 carbohydrate-binding module family 20 domain-containing protein [Spirochaetota bacterium]HPP03350.1 carbohydrate-binding module family 20 domain-containing protein [Spirochaetota bacterium]
MKKVNKLNLMFSILVMIVFLFSCAQGIDNPVQNQDMPGYESNPFVMTETKLVQNNSNTGMVSINVFEVKIINGNYDVSTPLVGAGIYVDGVLPYGGSASGYTNSNGNATISLTEGTHTFVIAKMTSSHSYYVSKVYTTTVYKGMTTEIYFSVCPIEAKVTAHIDVGWGNALYITGQGDLLGSWQTAYKMSYSNGTWVYNGYLPKGIEYKVVKYSWVSGNEIPTTYVQWEKGYNHRIENNGPYTNNDIWPQF